MNVLEHELIHFIIGIINCKDGRPGHIKGDPIYKSHGIYFHQLMKAYFGHTKCTHRLHEDGNENNGKREDFTLGQYVTYKSKDGSKVFGKIDKLNPKRAVIGDMSVSYEILKPASEYQIIKYIDAMNENGDVDFLTQTQNTQTINQGVNKFNVGDIITYTRKMGDVVTARITQVNPKTYYIGKTAIWHNMARIPTTEEETHFLQSPAGNIIEKTRSDFHVGQIVSFTHSKTRQVITGPIEKLNPSRAIVNNYSIPYCMLS
jgi:exosome complex RNA-binding protein Csl4